MEENRKTVKNLEKFKQKCINYKGKEDALNSTFSSNEQQQ